MQYKINIPDGANLLIHTLQDNGYSAYVVGGCVRDSILGREPHDWDICTSATPEQMIEVFKDKRVIKTGLQHGTITVVVDKIPYEITTYRIDGDYSDSRRPDSVTFTDDLIEDLKRRDFTINAMAYNDIQGLIDPFGGVEDIEYEKIRCVGSAKDRFNEDALRILRAIRFASQLEFIIEPETHWQIHQLYKNLENISVERINSEFCKMVSFNSFCVELILYKDVFSLFIPELKDIVDFPQNNPWHIYNVFVHTVHAIAECDSKDLITKLAVFFHDFGKPHSYQDGGDGVRHFKGHAKVSAIMTDEIMKRLRFDNNTRNKVVELVSYHDSTFQVGKKYVKKWLNKVGEEQFKRLLDLKEADNKAQNLERSKDRINELQEIKALIDKVLQEQECFSLKDLAVNGTDVMETGVKQGKQVGEILNLLLDMVINGEIENKKDKLLNYIKEREL